MRFRASSRVASHTTRVGGAAPVEVVDDEAHARRSGPSRPGTAAAAAGSRWCSVSAEITTSTDRGRSGQRQRVRAQQRDLRVAARRPRRHVEGRRRRGPRRRRGSARPARRAQRTSARGMSAPPVPTSSTVATRPRGDAAEQPRARGASVTSAAPEERRSAARRRRGTRGGRRAGAGRSSSSSASARAAGHSRASGPRAWTAQSAHQRRRAPSAAKPGPSAIISPQSSGAGRRAPQHLVEHEDDRGRGHVAELAQHAAGRPRRRPRRAP